MCRADLEFPNLILLVKKLAEKLGPENCKRSIESLLKILPSYELDLNRTTKVTIAFQAHIFHYKTGNFLLSIPNQFDPTMRQIYFVSDIPVAESKVLHHMSSLKRYFKTFGKFCFFCKKHFKSRGCNHKCSRCFSCFACKRPFLDIKTFLTDETEAFYCNGRLFPSITQKCPSCNIYYMSANCFEEHKKKVCRWGWKCPKCDIFQGRNGFFKTQQEIQSKHICGERYCNFCGQLKHAIILAV